MTFLFLLVGISALVFTMATSYTFGPFDPIIFCGIGWASVVVAYYLSEFVDHARVFILNRNYEAYIVHNNGTFWDGRDWVKKGTPRIFYNNFQVHETLKALHANYQIDADELYIKVILPQAYFDRINEPEDGPEEDE